MTASTIDDLRQWPATVPLWPDAAGALGLSRTTVYELVRRGELPVRTLRLGRLLRVPTAELLAVLGIPLDPQATEVGDATQLAHEQEAGTGPPTHERRRGGGVVRSAVVTEPVPTALSVPRSSQSGLVQLGGVR